MVIVNYGINRNRDGEGAEEDNFFQIELAKQETGHRECNSILSVGPILKGKMLDIYMARPFSRDTVVDCIDSRHVIFIEGSGAILWVANFQKDSKKVFSVLGSCNSSKKLSFRTGRSNSGLSFRAI